MNNRIMNQAWVIPCLIFLSSCTVYRSVQKREVVTTQIKLREDNFQVVEHVSGMATCPFLLWLWLPDPMAELGIPPVGIALGNPNVREQAMVDLHTKCDLKGKPRLLHNVLEDFTVSSYMGFFAVMKVTIIADVVEFVGDENTALAERAIEFNAQKNH